MSRTALLATLTLASCSAEHVGGESDASGRHVDLAQVVPSDASIDAAVDAGPLLPALAPCTDRTPVFPLWEPDPRAIGYLRFFDTLGREVNGGDLRDSPFIAYAAASGHPPPA